MDSETSSGGTNSLCSPFYALFSDCVGRGIFFRSHLRKYVVKSRIEHFLHFFQHLAGRILHPYKRGKDSPEGCLVKAGVGIQKLFQEVVNVIDRIPRIIAILEPY